MELKEVLKELAIDIHHNLGKQYIVDELEHEDDEDGETYAITLESQGFKFDILIFQKGE